MSEQLEAALAKLHQVQAAALEDDAVLVVASAANHLAAALAVLERKIERLEQGRPDVERIE